MDSPFLEYPQVILLYTSIFTPSNMQGKPQTDIPIDLGTYPQRPLNTISSYH